MVRAVATDLDSGFSSSLCRDAAFAGPRYLSFRDCNSRCTAPPCAIPENDQRPTHVPTIHVLVHCRQVRQAIVVRSPIADESPCEHLDRPQVMIA